jgi:hypothetical protein
MSRTKLMSRTRWKIGHRYSKPTTLRDDHPAITNGTTYFPTTVRTPSGSEWVLKAGENQTKLGSHIIKGAWKGYPILSLSLVERETCSRGCSAYSICYGNNMRYAHRWKAGPELIEQLDAELTHFSRLYAGGFAVRLHTLGDFFSTAYVQSWSAWMDQHRPTHCFGFTAWAPDEPIGRELGRLMNRHPDRFRIRWSNREGPNSTRMIKTHPGEPSLDGIPICPAQIDPACRAYLGPEQYEKRQRLTCGSCAYCWSSDRQIIFVEH